MTVDHDVLGEIETQIAVLMRLAEATRRADPARGHRALDRAAYVILRHLDDAGPLNVSVLAARLNLDGSTVTRQVGAMEREGLVRRDADPRDGRGTVVTPTAHGRDRMTEVRTARRALYGDLLADWPADDRATFAALLGRLNSALDGRFPKPA